MNYEELESKIVDWIKDDEVAGYNLYKTDYQKFIEYNIKDVEIVKKLDDKMKLLDLLITIAYESQINFEDVFSPVRTWEAIIYNFLKSIKSSFSRERIIYYWKWIINS